MRVVALLVVACGCRVGALPGIDAATPSGDGLPERVITDAPLWADVRTIDAAPDARPSDRDNDADGSTGDDRDVGADVDGPCQLLAPTCPDRDACYPYPFEGVATGETRCAFQGAGGPSVPCQSQLECDGTTICAAPGQPNSVCLSRCDLASSLCPVGTDCFPLALYPGVGVCR